MLTTLPFPKPMRYILWIGYGLLLIGCANNTCSDVSPPPIAPIVFYFTDTTGTNLINDQNAPFHPDSIKIRKDNQAFSFNKEYNPQAKGYTFSLYPGGETAGSDLFLIDLNTSDTDSLEVRYTVRTGECFSVILYTGFFYNGKEVYPDPQRGSIQLIKDL